MFVSASTLFIIIEFFAQAQCLIRPLGDDSAPLIAVPRSLSSLFRSYGPPPVLAVKGRKRLIASRRAFIVCIYDPDLYGALRIMGSILIMTVLSAVRP